MGMQDRKGEGFFGFLEHGDCGMDFTDISGMSDFPQRKFFFCFSQNMVAIAPEIADLCFGRVREMDEDAEAGIRISFWNEGVIEAVFRKRGFQVVLSDFDYDGTGIHDEMFSGNDFFIEGLLDQADTDVFQERMRGFVKKLRKPFDGRRGLIGIESYRLSDDGIVIELKGQI